MKYILSAYDTRMARRNTISKPLSHAEATDFKKRILHDNKIAATPFYNKLTNIKIEKMATKKRAKKITTKKNKCAVELGAKGGKKTLSLGHGIFADVYKKKRKAKSKATTKRKTTARKRTTARKKRK